LTSIAPSHCSKQQFWPALLASSLGLAGPKQYSELASSLLVRQTRTLWRACQLSGEALKAVALTSIHTKHAGMASKYACIPLLEQKRTKTLRAYIYIYNV
jgi:hypothetical protein